MPVDIECDISGEDIGPTMRAPFLLFLFLLPWLLKADHFSGSRLTYACMGGNNYRVYLDLYMDCSGAPLPPQTLYFNSACGMSYSIGNLTPISVTEISPVCDDQLSNTTCNGGTQPGFRHHRFQVNVNLGACSSWNINWNECCRNTMVNIQNLPGIYLTATVNTLGGFCDRSPVFTTEGIPFGCVNVPLEYNAGVVDPDGHAMTYALINARFASPTPTSVTYSPGYSGAQPIPGITLDPVTGQISFTATVAGYYTIVLQVTSYKPDGSVIGRVMYDMMVVIRACAVQPPEFNGLDNGMNSSILGPDEFVICPGTAFCVDMLFASNAPSSQVTVNTNSSMVMPGATFQQPSGDPAPGTLCWTAPSSLAQNSIILHLQINNGVCPIPGTASMAVTAHICDPLPVELLGFTATPLPQAILVEWSTGSEWDMDHFKVERSSDGLHFQVVEQIVASGDSHQRTDYTFLDHDRLEGLQYYRLREVDTDGSERVGPPVTAWPLTGRDLYVRPDGQGGMLAGGAPPYAPWHLIDATGRHHAMGQADMHGLVQLRPIMIGPGMHILMIQVGSEVKGLKLPVVTDVVR